MGPPSYMRSVFDRNVVMRRIPVFWDRLLLSLPAMLLHQRVVFDYKPKQVIYEGGLKSSRPNNEKTNL
jgi:hypothetical protein